MNDALAQRHGNDSSRCRITASKRRVFWLATLVSSIAQLCDGHAERPEALKPFVACRYLIIVIPLYAWEPIRVMTINDNRNGSRRDVQFSGDAGAVSGDWLKNGEGRADDSP